MEENKKMETELQELEERSSFDINAIIKMLVLNWQWFILSLIICVGLGLIHLRYTTPQHRAFAKILIKDDESAMRGGRNSLQFASAASLGMISASNGFDNEMEILKSRSIAEQTVRNMKLYVDYYKKGRIKYLPVYLSQPFNVDMDDDHLNELYGPVKMDVKYDNNGYKVEGIYYLQGESTPLEFNKTFATLPATISTEAGVIHFTANENPVMEEGDAYRVILRAPMQAAIKYVNGLSVSPTSKTTTIANLVLVDAIPNRAIDYLNQLVESYNFQANEDKNLITQHTDEFIAQRLEKIGLELGQTEDELENYKKQHGMVEIKLDATQAVQQQTIARNSLEEARLQISIIDEVMKDIDANVGQYKLIASGPGVGLTDQASNTLIAQYNSLVNERNRLLINASEINPAVVSVTSQLDELAVSVKNAMSQAKKNQQIRLRSIERQYGGYAGQVARTPSQEHQLTSYARQQDVMSGLYLMLLQKREENAIQQAAVADKGKLIDDPAWGGKVSPRGSIILLAALLLGLALPAVIIYLLQFFRYKIEGHEDVAALTKLPILADVAVASETAKTKADIVVHENQNNQMDEIFRGMRTNLQFMLADNQKVVIFTSSTSGEGKTFNAANLGVSFALLEKKVILVGLDIRKTRLAELFEINDRHHGITPLLGHNEPTWAEIKEQIISSGVSKNLDLLLAGPIPPNPAELMARKSLDVIVNHLRDNYDYIIIDTAPVGLVTDTLQIARVADASIFVCRADYTPKESFGLVNQLAEEKKLPNMSIVINGIDMSKKKYGYAYGYGKYARYSRYGKGAKYSNYGTSYRRYSGSHYADKDDNSIKR